MVEGVLVGYMQRTAFRGVIGSGRNPIMIYSLDVFAGGGLYKDVSMLHILKSNDECTLADFPKDQSCFELSRSMVEFFRGIIVEHPQQVSIYQPEKRHDPPIDCNRVH